MTKELSSNTGFSGILNCGVHFDLYFDKGCIPLFNKDCTPLKTTVFTLNFFKPSGKFYTAAYIVLPDYSPLSITNLQSSKDEKDRMLWYHIYNDIINYVKYDRTFHRDMYVTITCPEYYPTLIPIMED